METSPSADKSANFYIFRDTRNGTQERCRFTKVSTGIAFEMALVLLKEEWGSHVTPCK